jgi:hypothetical protein
VSAQLNGFVDVLLSIYLSPLTPCSAHEEWKALSEVADIVLPKATNPTEFAEEVKSGAFDDVHVIYRTFQSISITGLLDEKLIKILPENIKFICHYGLQLPSFSPNPFLLVEKVC